MTTELSARQLLHRAYLQSDAWRRRRDAFRASAGGRCLVCGSRRVDVLHLDYANAGAGLEPDDDLVLLCRDHHELAHELGRCGYFPSLRAATAAMVSACMLPPVPVQQSRSSHPRRLSVLAVWVVLVALWIAWVIWTSRSGLPGVTP